MKTDAAGLDANLIPAALRATFPERYASSRSWTIDLDDARRFLAEYARLSVADGPGPEERLRLIAALAAVRSRGETAALSGEHVHWTDADVADLLLA